MLEETNNWTEEERELRRRVMAGETVVASMRKNGHPNLLKWARRKDLYQRIDNRTKWGNPHKTPRDGDRDEVVDFYETRHLPDHPELLEAIERGELDGKVLACWCAPKRCHGDVLRALVDKRRMSNLDGTAEDRRVRELIRQHASGQEGYDARLYDLWDEWNGEFFGGRMVPALVQITDPGQTQCYGSCAAYSGLAGIRSAIKIRRSILDGTLRDLRNGSRDKEGLRKFLEDVLLHEMIHQYHFEVTGEHDASWSGHGPAFSAMANEIGRKLGLPPVRRTCKKRDGEEPSPSQWPHNVRRHEYYRGAHVPSTVDEEMALRKALVRMIEKHGAPKILRLTRELSDIEDLEDALARPV
jgi:Domain of unknown function (DUF4326)/SprT-like family